MPITFGAEKQLVNGNSSDMVIRKWASGQIVILVNETSAGNKKPAVGLSTISGTVINSMTKKTIIHTGAQNWDYLDLDILVSGSKLCASGVRNISGFQAYGLVASEGASVFTFDSVGAAVGNDIVETACCMLNTTSFLVVADDHLILMSVSGDTPSVDDNASTLGGTPRFISAVGLSSTKAVACYADSADSDKLKGQVINVSGASVTSVGAQQTLDGSIAYVYANRDVGAAQKRTIKINSTTFLTVYRDDTGDDLKAVICTVSGDTITPGTPVVLADSSTNQGGTACDIFGSEALIGVSNLETSNPGQVSSIQYSGTTITDDNNDAEFDNGEGAVRGTSIAAISMGKWIVGWVDGTGSDPAFARVAIGTPGSFLLTHNQAGIPGVIIT